MCLQTPCRYKKYQLKWRFTAVAIDESGPSQWGSHSLASHTLRREEGYGYAATIELSPRQKLDVTNQIHALRKSDLLSWNTIMSHVQQISAFYCLTAMFDNCVPRRQLGSCSVTGPFLSLRRVWLVRLGVSDTKQISSRNVSRLGKGVMYILKKGVSLCYPSVHICCSSLYTR